MDKVSLRNRAKKDVRRVLRDFRLHLKSIGQPMEPISFGAMKAMFKYQLEMLQRTSI